MSLVELGWRRFKFFDQALVKDPTDLEKPFEGLLELDAVGWSRAGDDGVLIAERSGGVVLMSSKYTMDYWKAYKTCIYDIHHVQQLNVAVTIGDDDEGVNPQIKVWALDRKDASNTPFCVRVTRTQPPNNRVTKASRICTDEAGTYLFVGFDDSTVLMYRGHVSKDKASKPTVIRDGVECASDGAVTGLFVRTLRDRRVVLFVTTTQSVISYVIVDKNVTQRTVHNARGCSRVCCALTSHQLEYQLVVAKRDYVHLYNPEQCAESQPLVEGRCHGFEADKEKLMMCVLDSYLLLVTKDTLNPIGDGDQRMNMLTVYDLVGQYIAYNGPIQQVQLVFAHWGSFFLVTKAGRLYRLNDQNINTKLDVLFRKNLYDVAIGLAKRHFCNQSDLIGIFKQHADYLYEKGDYENAVAQYVQTIGTLEHSYVIRKFLDAQRIAQLTVYLEALHERGTASGDHTTMLLNCYTKLHNQHKLDAFADNARLQWKYDVNTAIRVLRKAGYLSQAARLAERHGRHDQVVRILIDEQQEYAKAIRYIAKMDDFKAAITHVKFYGKLLMSKEADATVELLNALVHDAEQLRLKADYDGNIDDEYSLSADLQPATDLDYMMKHFVKLFVDEPVRLRTFLENHLKMSSSQPSTGVCITLLELNLIEYAKTPSEEKSSKIMAFLRKYTDSIDKSQALVLCQTYSFTAGIVWLYEQSQLFDQVMKIYMDDGNFDGVLSCCEKYGSDDPNMWIDALWFVSKRSDIGSDDVKRLIVRIEQKQILPPMMVLEILSNSTTVTLAVVKEYLLGWLSRENELAVKYEDEIRQHESEIHNIGEKIHDLKTKPAEFKLSKCRACDTPLEVPTVHFLCYHAYHKHCFESYAESDAECPACAPEHKRIRGQLTAQNQRRKDAYQILQKELRDSDDLVSTIADHFGRGLFVDTGNQKDVTVSVVSPTKIRPQPLPQPVAKVKPLDTPVFTVAPAQRPAKSVSPAIVAEPSTVTADNPFEEDEYPDDMNPFD